MFKVGILQWRIIVHFSKPTECATQRESPDVNHGLWVVMMCWLRFIDSNHILWWYRMSVMGEAAHAWGQGFMESVYFLPNFAESRTAVKK